MTPRPSHAPLLLLAVLLPACPPAPDDPADTDTTDSTDTGPAPAFFQDFTFTRSELIPTVVTASWETAEPATCTLRYGAVGDLDLSFNETGEPSTHHEVPLIGLQPETAGSLEVNAGEWVSDQQPFSTGQLPSDVPSIQLEVDDPRAFHGYTLVPLLSDGAVRSWICIFDGQGELVWAVETPHGASRARLAPDGGGVIFMDEDTKPDGTNELGAVISVAWDGRERWRFEREDIHHDFAILDHDRFMVLGWTTYTLDPGLETERDLRGDVLIEFDSAGDALQRWSVFDDLDPHEIPSTAEPPTSGAWDWSHANYITWVPETQEVLISLRELDAIAAVDVELGRMSWSLSNGWGTYQSIGEARVLDAPHSVELIDGGLAVFNQVYRRSLDACSWGAALALDAEQGQATVAWRHENADCARVYYLGSTQPLPNDHMLVVFSQAGVMEEVTPEGEVVRSYRSSLGWIFGYAYQTDELRDAAR